MGFLPLLAVAAAGYVGWNWYKKEHPSRTDAQKALEQPGGAPLPVALDSNMDDFHKSEVINALYYMNDPNLLGQMAVGYSQAGFPIAASLLAGKALSLRPKAA